MPIYEFSCSKCEKVIEKICNSATAEISCPECGTKAKRIVSVFASQTDSRSQPAGGCMPGSGFT